MNSHEEPGEVLYVPVVPTALPCEECSAKPAFRYTLVGISGVLCAHCLLDVQNEVNRMMEQLQKLERENDEQR